MAVRRKASRASFHIGLSFKRGNPSAQAPRKEIETFPPSSRPPPSRPAHAKDPCLSTPPSLSTYCSSCHVQSETENSPRRIREGAEVPGREHMDSAQWPQRVKEGGDCTFSASEQAPYQDALSRSNWMPLEPQCKTARTEGLHNNRRGSGRGSIWLTFPKKISSSWSL